LVEHLIDYPGKHSLVSQLGTAGWPLTAPFEGLGTFDGVVIEAGWSHSSLVSVPGGIEIVESEIVEAVPG